MSSPDPTPVTPSSPHRNRSIDSAIRYTVNLPRPLSISYTAEENVPTEQEERSIIILSPRRSPSPSSRSSSPQRDIVPPRISFTSGHGLAPVTAEEGEGEEEDDGDEDGTLFINSLLTGHSAQSRRRLRASRSRPTTTTTTGDQPATYAQVASTIEGSRLLEEFESSWSGFDQFEREQLVGLGDSASASAGRTERNGADDGSINRIWRNDPIDIQRSYSDVVRLPRGGAALTRALPVTSTSTSSSSNIRSTSIRPRPIRAPDIDLRSDENGERTFSFSWTRTRSPDDLWERSPSPLDGDSHQLEQRRTDEDQQEEEGYEFIDPSRRGNLSNLMRGEGSGMDLPFGFTTLTSSSSLNPNRDREREMRGNHPWSFRTTTTTTSTGGNRTREETSQLMGQTLRMKKNVWLLYCGSRKDDRDEYLPHGWHWKSSNDNDVCASSDKKNVGCGTLICSRGLLEVPKKVFDPFGPEKEMEDAVSSDLPPSSKNVGEVNGKMTLGTRGVIGCKGCTHVDLACRHCGNILGYRVLNPCAPCKTPAASVVGLLWHYRRSSITLLPRLNGLLPSPSISLSSPPPSPPLISSSTTLCDRTGRLITSQPCLGSQTKWNQLPHPQVDFEDGLISEPSEWFNPETENSWLDSGIDSNRCVDRVVLPSLNDSTERDRDATGAGVGPLPEEEGIFSPRNRTLRLSATLGGGGISLGNGAWSGTSGSGLSRSGAIRRPRSSSGLLGDRDEEGGRRVRRRIDPDALDRVDVERLTSGAGYGVAFEGSQGLRSDRSRTRMMRLLAARRQGNGMSSSAGAVGR